MADFRKLFGNAVSEVKAEYDEFNRLITGLEKNGVTQVLFDKMESVLDDNEKDYYDEGYNDGYDDGYFDCSDKDNEDNEDNEDEKENEDEDDEELPF